MCFSLFVASLQPMTWDRILSGFWLREIFVLLPLRLGQTFEWLPEAMRPALPPS